MSLHALLSKASVLVRASYHVIAVYDLIGGEDSWASAMKTASGRKEGKCESERQETKVSCVPGPMLRLLSWDVGLLFGVRCM